jgi:hypothetical protein
MAHPTSGLRVWYSHGELSQRKAAEIAGTRRAEFVDDRTSTAFGPLLTRVSVLHPPFHDQLWHRIHSVWLTCWRWSHGAAV